MGDNADFEDFCGQNDISLEGIDEELVKVICHIIHYEANYSMLFSLDCSTYKVLHAVMYAFSESWITRSQVASILEYHEIKKTFNEVFKTPILLPDKSDFTEKAKMVLSQLLSNQEKSLFYDEILKQPESEQCFFNFNVAKLDDEIQSLLTTSIQYKVMAKSDIEIKEKSVPFYSYFSVGARDALATARFRENAKKLFPRLGEFSIDDIERAVRKGGRYAAVAFPRVQSPLSFHDVEASPFYLGLHDEIHRVAISGISNSLLEGLLHGIDVIRATLNQDRRVQNKKPIKWSKGIWDTLDLGTLDFNDDTNEIRESSDLWVINDSFCRLLSPNVYPENRRCALFFPSAFSDTTWLLLLHIYENKDDWLNNYGVVGDYFPIHSIYRELYDFICAKQNDWDYLTTPAQKVHYLKSTYLGLGYIRDLNASFILSNRFIEIASFKNPIGLSKKDFMSLENPCPSANAIRYFARYDTKYLAKHLENIGSIRFLVDNQPNVATDILMVILDDKYFFNIVLGGFSLLAMFDVFKDSQQEIARFISMQAPTKWLEKVLLNPVVISLLGNRYPDVLSQLEAAFPVINQVTITSQQSKVYQGMFFPVQNTELTSTSSTIEKSIKDIKDIKETKEIKDSSTDFDKESLFKSNR